MSKAEWHSSIYLLPSIVMYRGSRVETRHDEVDSRILNTPSI
jgi:hypothetical protein